MPPKRGAKAEEPAPPKRGAKAAAKEAPPKRGAKAEPEPPPKRGGAKAAPEPPPPKRGGAKAKAEAPEPPPPKRGAAKAAAAEPEPAPAENYDSWSVQKLQARLKELGVTATGSKASLVARLTACAAAAPATSKAEAAPQEDAPASGTKRKAPEPKASEPKASEAAPAPKKARTPEPKASKPPLPADEPSSSQPSSSQQGPVTYEDGEFKADYAKSNRSACKKCKETIDLGKMRLGKMVPSDKFDGKVPMWYHSSCFLGQSTLPRSTGLISGFSTLRPEDQEVIMQRVPPPGGDGEGGDSGQDELIRQQNEKVFKVHDVLSAMGVASVKEMLELNGYPTVKTGVTTTPLELAADGIVFGATGHCEVCKDEKRPLLLSGEGYRCGGFVNEYLKCSFKTQTPPRKVWQLTEAAKLASGGYLKKLRLKTGDRLFASKLGEVDAESGVVMSAAASSTQLPLVDIEVAVIGRGKNMTKEEIVELVQKNGGTFVESMSKLTTCVVTTEETANEEPEHDDVETAKEFGVPGVEDTFLTESVENGGMQDMAPYLLWGEPRKRKRKIEETTTSRFIEKDGVSMDADVGELAEKAHVLVDMATKTVYSEMMNRTDLVTGVNSFYTLHLLESDDTSTPQYWLFRKWGRIGVSQGGTKVEDFTSKEVAISKFKYQYEDKTGNAFGIKKEDFVVKKGKFIRVDMQHKVLSGKKAKTGETGAGGGGGDQPLGQLSKAQIEKGDAVLDKIDAVLNEGIDPKSPVGSARYLALSAEFYSVIPHNFGMNRPPTISNPDMVGAERALLQFYLRMGFEDMDQADTSLTPISGVMDLPLPKTLEESAKKVCAAKDIKACDKKAVGLAKKQAGKPNEVVEASQYGAILLYTANAIYKDLNKCLRDEDRAKVERYFSYLRLLFEACRRLPQRERTLWRGIGVDLSESYKVGSTIIWWGVSSCTSEKKVAQDFMSGCGDKATFLTVETKTACDISELSFYSNEAESILLPGTQLEVIKSEKMGKNAAITLREVGRVVN